MDSSPQLVPNRHQALSTKVAMVPDGQASEDLMLHVCMFAQQQNGARHSPHVDVCQTAMAWNEVRCTFFMEASMWGELQACS